MVVKPVFQFRSLGCFFQFLTLWCFKKKKKSNKAATREVLQLSLKKENLVSINNTPTKAVLVSSALSEEQNSKSFSTCTTGTRVAQRGGGKVQVRPAHDLSQLSGEQHLHGAVYSAWVHPHRLGLNVAQYS